ncbi:endonuclease/exonuclease/phosphatase family protein [Ancylobacter sp. FA202]|uniref:endonuclease/exonuclease/phosphatase family protein n=1 Tax=Ancylobacter sp. FA202 TaxID=1111106 RepID=UPI0012DEB52F|nr:endonuclease/exonuclease/phosphatase family protein [Ancylobacter sp. FA202]
MIRLAFGLSLLLIAGTAQANTLTVATWNLGWHMSRDEAAAWIKKCSAPFTKNIQSGKWEPASEGTPGWELRWGRDAPISWDIANWAPCDVYKANFKIVHVTEAAYRKRDEQIADLIRSRLKADIIAFQEVTGVQAIRDVLPDNGKDYQICSYDAFKVQRLGFAWKKELGAGECKTEIPLSLPQLPVKDQVRPGLLLTLNIEKERFHLFNVHLKSSCVTPVESEPGNTRGALAGDNPHCQILQQQIMPLENWIERAGENGDRLIVLGDFNRAVWHELHLNEPVRTDGSSPVGPLTNSAKVNSLLREVNDGSPTSSNLSLLPERCPVSTEAQASCAIAEAPADKTAWREATKALAAANELGCRNPVGLDHILLGPGLSAPGAMKLPLQRMGRTLAANATHPDPLLSLSDHCPLVADVTISP